MDVSWLAHFAFCTHPCSMSSHQLRPKANLLMNNNHIWIILLFQIIWYCELSVECRRDSPNVQVSGYSVLGQALHAEYFPAVSPTKLSSILKSLAGAQTTFKRLDGISHELYQRTHTHNRNLQSTVGRASRTAARTGSCADALFGCELCSWFSDYLDSNRTYDTEQVEYLGWNSTIGTLYAAGGRELLFTTSFNYSISLQQRGSTEGIQGKSSTNLHVPISVAVLYEPHYRGGYGLNHGGIDALIQGERENILNNTKGGRILIIIQDGFHGDLTQTLRVLDVEPEYIDLDIGLISKELACVNGHIWRMAAMVLSKIGPSVQKACLENSDQKQTLQTINTTVSSDPHPVTIHFVGQSLAGSIATLAAVMMDGCVPLPSSRDNRRSKSKASSKRKAKRRKRKLDSASPEIMGDNTQHLEDMDDSMTTMHAYGRGHTSAITLGSPPCLSSNIKAAFVTSLIHGDDVISRCTRASLDRLRQRIERSINGSFLSNKVGWVSDTFSLTVSNIMSHAHGSEGEEARLSIPGKVFLIRPRRLGGTCSIHEVRGFGGREALRAAVLWQLNDVLLSKSLWKHHLLPSYVNALDRVDK